MDLAQTNEIKEQSSVHFNQCRPQSIRLIFKYIHFSFTALMSNFTFDCSPSAFESNSPTVNFNLKSCKQLSSV